MLQELRIVNVKMVKDSTNQLLETIISENYLKKLSLVNVNLPGDSLILVRTLIMKGTIKDLDISWN
jgi:hypothetical protein